MASIGERIKIKRKELGLTQAELGEKLNISDRAVSKWEQGEGDPNLTIIPDIAKILGVSLDYLLLGKEDELISIDDMDDAKRLSYLIKKDDAESFAKYKYNDSSRLFITDRFGRKSINVKVWKEIIDANAKSVFSLCCSELVNDKNNRKRRDNDSIFYYAINFAPVVNGFVKMVVDIDRPDYLEVIGLRFYGIGGNSLNEEEIRHFQNNPSYCRQAWTNGNIAKAFNIAPDTLEYFFLNANKSKKCFNYITSFKFKYQYSSYDQPQYVYTRLEERIISLAIQYDQIDAIKKIKQAFETELANIQTLSENYETSRQLIETRLLRNSYDDYGRYDIIDGRVFVFSRSNIEALLLKNKTEEAKELIAYNQKAIEVVKTSIATKEIKDFSAPTMTEQEIEKFVMLNSSSTSEEEKERLRCIDNGVLVIGKALRVRDLKLLKEILDQSVYNPFEKVCRYYLSSDFKSLYKCFLDLNLSKYAELLLSNDKAKLPLTIKNSFKQFAKQQNPLDAKVMEQFEQEAVQVDFGIKSIETSEDEDRFNACISKYCIEKMYAHIQNLKEEVLLKVKKALEEEEAKRQFEKERTESKKGLTKEYFTELLSSGKAKDQKIFILDLCSLFDAILKYDYQCEGEDFFGRMNAYNKKFAPQSRSCDDGWGEYVTDTKYEKEVVQPWKQKWNLVSRLRMMRNNIAHSEHNEVEDLTQEELTQCLDFIFSINKEE